MLENRLKKLRIKSGFSQKDFYEKIISSKLGLNITLRTYQNWEKPENEIKSKPALLLADYFMVDVNYLLGISDYRNPFEQLANSEGTNLGNGITGFSQTDLNQVSYKDSFMNFLKLHDFDLSNDDIDKIINLVQSLSDTNKKLLNNIVMTKDIDKLEELKNGDFSSLFNYNSNWSDKYNTLKDSDK